jgi:predicted dehydrogenase
MAPRTSDTIQTYELPRIPSDVRDYYRNFIKAICGEEEQIVTHEQMLRGLTLVEAVFESAEKGEIINKII